MNAYFFLFRRCCYVSLDGSSWISWIALGNPWFSAFAENLGHPRRPGRPDCSCGRRKTNSIKFTSWNGSSWISRIALGDPWFSAFAENLGHPRRPGRFDCTCCDAKFIYSSQDATQFCKKFSVVPFPTSQNTYAHPGALLSKLSLHAWESVYVWFAMWKSEVSMNAVTLATRVETEHILAFQIKTLMELNALPRGFNESFRGTYIWCHSQRQFTNAKPASFFKLLYQSTIGSIPKNQQ